MIRRSPTSWFLGVLVLLATAPRMGEASATLPPVPASKVFAAWLVACNNTRRCEVTFLLDSSSSASTAANGTTLTITHNAGLEGIPTLQSYGERSGAATKAAISTA